MDTAPMTRSGRHRRTAAQQLVKTNSTLSGQWRSHACTFVMDSWLVTSMTSGLMSLCFDASASPSFCFLCVWITPCGVRVFTVRVRARARVRVRATCDAICTRAKSRTENKKTFPARCHAGLRTGHSQLMASHAMQQRISSQWAGQGTRITYDLQRRHERCE